MSLRVLLADDHPLVRRGIGSLLESEPDMVIVGEAGDGPNTLDLAHRLQPDILVLDLILPGLGGLELLPLLADRAPQTRTVMLSLYGHPPLVAQAIRSGSLGYVLKGESEEELLHTIREVSRGRLYLSQQLNRAAIEVHLKLLDDNAPDSHDTLTIREREILQLVAKGCTSSQIGRQLYISTRTVENHRANLKRKLHLTNQVDLVRYALRHGVILLEE